MNDIRVSALVLLHPHRRELLMVRKAGTTSFMLPGGKPEAGETAEETIVREIEEELGLSLSRERLRALGTFSAVAANEADHRVIGDVFCYEGLPDRLDVDDIRHLAEIAEAGFDGVGADLVAEVRRSSQRWRGDAHGRGTGDRSGHRVPTRLEGSTAHPYSPIRVDLCTR